MIQRAIGGSCAIGGAMVALLVWTAMGQDRAPDIKVNIKDVSELRSDPRAAPLLMGHPARPGWHGVAYLQLAFNGPDARNATRYRDLNVFEAVDDQGASILMPSTGPTQPAEASAWIPFKRDIRGGASSPCISLTVQPSQRRATKIVRVRGQIVIQSGGAIKTLHLSHLRSALGKDIQDSVLKAANIRLDITPSSDPNPTNSLELELTGQRVALSRAEVMDAGDATYTSQVSQLSSMGALSCRIVLERPVDDRMTLDLSILVDQRVSTVPLEVTDVPLP